MQINSEECCIGNTDGKIAGAPLFIEETVEAERIVQSERVQQRINEQSVKVASYTKYGGCGGRGAASGSNPERFCRRQACL